jgi:cytochrome b subunit of formate dehydrogenase
MRFAGRILVGAVLFSLMMSGAAGAAHKAKNDECLACHEDASLTKEVGGKAISLRVDPERFKHSVHGEVLGCVDCHGDVKAEPHETTPKKVACVTCHADQQAAYAHSFHAKARKADGTPAANCEDCHGGVHTILAGSEARSPVAHGNIPATCGRCHGQKFLMEASGASSQAFVSYQESVHGKAIAKGSTTAAVCTDCHGAHETLPANDPSSPISKFNVPGTCGKCHGQVADVFRQSIHGQAVARGNGLAPVCTDCHGIHSIKNHLDPASSVAEQNVARTTCARCHEGVRLSRELGVAGNRVSTYLDSYHGLASSGGSMMVANCASCHGVHNILPSSDPRSTINAANLDATCGKCHQGVTRKFTLSKVHMDGGGSGKGKFFASGGLFRKVSAGDGGSLAVLWVRRIYLALIAMVIGGMLLHNAILWRGKALARRRARGPVVLRMTRNQRWQHGVLLVSFVVLVVTGFALKFPESWFAELLGMGEKLRSVVHRVAGVVLIAAGVYHVLYAALSKEGRRLVWDFLPSLKDVRDAWGAMRYWLGWGGKRPEFGRFNYAEKAEYWALVWGSVLMAVTGVMLWAKVLVGNLLARMWLDAATAVHFYEAVLATLAIVVWHFYQVVFDPDVYPMNWAWRDGKMTAEHYREEHGLDGATLASSEDVEEGVRAAAKPQEGGKLVEKPIVEPGK